MVKYIKESIDKTDLLKCIKGVTLLTTDEAENLLTQEDRICDYNGRPSSWWLQTQGSYGYTVAYVSGYGDVNTEGNVPDYNRCGIRPALILNTTKCPLDIGDKFNFGKYNFKVISNDRALCDNIIELSAFRKDGHRKDSAVYTRSDAKRYLVRWFKDEMLNERGIRTDEQEGDLYAFGF